MIYVTLQIQDSFLVAEWTQSILFLFLLVNRHIMIIFFLMLYWSVSWYLQYIYLVTVEHRWVIP